MKKILVSVLTLLVMVSLFALSVIAEEAAPAVETETTAAAEAISTDETAAPAQDSTTGDVAAPAQIANPWKECTKGEAVLKVGLGFKIDSPKGFQLREVAYCTDAEGTPNGARFIYSHRNDMDVFRVHVIKEALTPMDTWKAIEKDGVAAYYDAQSSSIFYAQGDCSITVDMAGYTEEQLTEFVGAVKLQFPEATTAP